MPDPDSVHQLEEAIRVRAWIVTARGTDVELDAEATAWTTRAVHVHYFDADGREGFMWLWSSAVKATPFTK